MKFRLESECKSNLFERTEYTYTYNEDGDYNIITVERYYRFEKIDVVIDDNIDPKDLEALKALDDIELDNNEHIKSWEFVNCAGSGDIKSEEIYWDGEFSDEDIELIEDNDFEEIENFDRFKEETYFHMDSISQWTALDT